MCVCTIDVDVIPRGKNPRTRTTTRTFPPPLSGIVLSIGTSSDSRERKDGVDADDLSWRISAVIPGYALGSNAISSSWLVILWIIWLYLNCNDTYIHIISRDLHFTRFGVK